MKSVVNNCTNQLSQISIDYGDYNLRWQQPNEDNFTNQIINKTQSAFTYSSVYEIESLPFWGLLGWYNGGGYVANLGNNPLETEVLLQELKSNAWIDKYTRVMFLEFNTWNPNTNLFSFVTISFEYLITGSLVYWTDIQSVQLYR